MARIDVQQDLHQILVVGRYSVQLFQLFDRQLRSDLWLPGLCRHRRQERRVGDQQVQLEVQTHCRVRLQCNQDELVRSSFIASSIAVEDPSVPTTRLTPRNK